ncbi:MAG: hypothetical protein ACO3LE_00960 [Bdellovibrionota bacterium]
MSIFRIIILSFIALGLSQMLSGQDLSLSENSRLIVLLDDSSRVSPHSRSDREDHIEAIIALAKNLKDQQELSVVSFSGNTFEWSKEDGEAKLKETLQSLPSRVPSTYTEAMRSLASIAKKNSSWKNDSDKLVIVLGHIKESEIYPSGESLLMQAYQDFEKTHLGRPVSYVVIDRSRSSSLASEKDVLSASRQNGKIDFNNVAFVRADDAESLMKKVEELKNIFFLANAQRESLSESSFSEPSTRSEPPRKPAALESFEEPARDIVFPTKLFTNERSKTFQQVKESGIPLNSTEAQFPFHIEISAENGGHRIKFTRKNDVIDQELLKKIDYCYQVDQFRNADLSTKTNCEDLRELSKKLEKERAFHDSIDLKSLLMSLSRPGKPISIETSSPDGLWSWLFGGEYSHEAWVSADRKQILDLIESYSSQQNLFFQDSKVLDLASKSPAKDWVPEEKSYGGRLEKPSEEVLNLLREIQPYREPTESEIEYEKSYFFDGIYISFSEHQFDFETLNEIEEAYAARSDVKTTNEVKDHWLSQWTKHNRYQIRNLLEEERWASLKTRYAEVFKAAGISVSEIKKDFRNGRAGIWVGFNDPFKPYQVFEALAQHHMNRGESNESLIEIFGDYYGASARDLQRQKDDPSRVEIRKTEIEAMGEIIRKLSNPECL